MLEKNLVFTAKTTPLCDPAVYERLYSSASCERREKIDRLKSEKEKRLSLGAYTLLLYALSTMGIDGVSFEYSADGKPYLKGSNVHFGISHSAERVMCVLSPLEVGCDVEEVRERSLSVAHRFFAPCETAYLDTLENEADKLHSFFRLWTLKESFVKYLGKGITLPLDSFSFDLSGDRVAICQDYTEKPLYFKEYDLGDEYKYSVCSECGEFSDALCVELDKI